MMKPAYPPSLLYPFANLIRSEEYMYDENLVHSGSKGDQQNLEKPNSAFIYDFYVKIRCLGQIIFFCLFPQ